MEFIALLENDFVVTETKPYTKPEKKHQMVLIMHEKWFTCDLKSHVIESAKSKPGDLTSTLDVQILNDRVLKPILNI